MVPEGIGSSPTHNDPTRRTPTHDGASGDASSEVRATADQVKDQAAQMTDQVKDQAGKVTDKAKEQATTRVEEQKERAAQGIAGFADTLNQVSGSMRDQNPAMANLADTAATRLEDFATSLRDKDINQIMSDVEDIARRQPAMFIGGAFLAGVVAARFLKSSGGMSGSSHGPSSERDSRHDDRRGYASQLGTSSYRSASDSSSGRAYSPSTGAPSRYSGSNDPYNRPHVSEPSSRPAGALDRTSGTYGNHGTPDTARTGINSSEVSRSDSSLRNASSERNAYARPATGDASGLGYSSPQDAEAKPQSDKNSGSGGVSSNN